MSARAVAERTDGQLTMTEIILFATVVGDETHGIAFS